MTKSFDILLGDTNVAVVSLGVSPTYTGYSVLTEDSIEHINDLIVEYLESSLVDWAMTVLDVQHLDYDQITNLIEPSDQLQLKPYLYAVLLREVGNDRAMVAFWDDEFNYGNLKDYLTERLSKVNWAEDSFETSQYFHG